MHQKANNTESATDNDDEETRQTLIVTVQKLMQQIKNTEDTNFIYACAKIFGNAVNNLENMTIDQLTDMANKMQELLDNYNKNK